jgi:hypothetical protein
MCFHLFVGLSQTRAKVSVGGPNKKFHGLYWAAKRTHYARKEVNILSILRLYDSVLQLLTSFSYICVNIDVAFLYLICSFSLKKMSVHRCYVDTKSDDIFFTNSLNLLYLE